MQRIRTFSHCVYREKSATTGKIVAAMAKATAEFEPLQFDQDGRDEDGREYRYASLAAINKATKKALSKHGLWLHCDYGFDDSGVYAVAVLEHDSGEFVASTLPIPPYSSIHRQKAAMTLMRRAAVEGLLGLSAEVDDDAQCCAGEEPASTEVNPKWLENERLARQAISEAGNPTKLDSVMEKVAIKVRKGHMDPDVVDALNELADARRSEITKEMEVAS